MLRSRRTVAALLLPVVVALGCGEAPSSSPSARRGLPYSALNTRIARLVTPTAATFRRPIAVYRRHVGRELGAMLAELRALQRAVRAGTLGPARAAWLRADARYETIGAAYGAFGDLDAAINGLPGGLRGGSRSPDFTGLHRVELALWGRLSTTDAEPYVRRLLADTARLRRRVPRIEIEPLDFGLRAHEVLEDSLHLQLAERASPWSSSALGALAANIAGTRVVLSALAPLANATNPLVVVLARRSLARLDAAIAGTRRNGRLPRWDALGRRDRERIAGFTAAAAERLAFVPGLVDPRVPRPAQTATAVSP